VNIFIPYNKQYVEKTYQFNNQHTKFIESFVIRHLLKRLIKNKLVTRVDFYSQSKSIIDGIQSNKLNFVQSISNENESSEEIIKDYLSIVKLVEPLVYYNLMFPFTDVSKINQALNNIKAGKYNSATGVIEKGVVWSDDAIDVIDPHGSTPSQAQITSSLDIGSFCIVKPESILAGYRRIKKPVFFVSLTSLEIINMRSSADSDIYELIVSSGMSL